MWHLFTLVSLLFLLQTTSTSENMDSKALSSAIAQFSAKFCVELEKGKSVVSSPLSAEFVLALLTLGTTDPAHSELLTALGIPDDASIRSSFSEVSSKLRALKGVTLNVANRVYVQEGPYDLEPKLKEDAVKVFNAAIEKLDFGTGGAAVEVINDWVANQTNQKIKDLLSSDSVDGDTRLVLINALYFKGTWKKQFDPANTMNQPFHITVNSSVEVPMMYKEDDYLYGDSSDLQAQLLEMPYQGGEATMLVVLPHEVEGLDSVLSKLASGFDLMSEVDKMYKTKVQVTIPKFKIETEIDLGQLLPKLGIKSIFNRENSGLTKVLNVEEPLFVSKAVQKAFIEVNEEGAEAAAATAMATRRARSVAQQFAADRAALWLVCVARQVALAGSYRPPRVVRDEL
ncbi:serine protease inhibitor 3/4 isoform X3 [Helicoverpa armigera]|uniref:serine protease inhibitor 3/4 isoform X3 n=1 Tax=Helicoverpa armigera TaxID=29058 RepID=UPI0030831B12